MARRTRSILIDATLGKIFINTSDNTPTDPSKLIAGTKLASNTVSATAKVRVYATQNLGGKTAGIPFVAGGLVVGAKLAVKVAPTGGPITVRIKVGASYNYAVTKETVSLSANALSATFPLNISVPAGHSVYYDIAQAGLVKPGYGLSITLNYYAG